jgi:hypothetical protein
MANYVTPPEFTIAACPTISWQEIATRRFDLISRYDAVLEPAQEVEQDTKADEPTENLPWDGPPLG